MTRDFKSDPRVWPARLRSFLAKMGGGDLRVGTGLAATIAATAIVYSRCLGSDFIFDDHFQIVSNRFIGEWSYLWKSFVYDSWWFENPSHLPVGAYYRPLEGVWLALNFHLFGRSPIGWHAECVVMHLFVVWLVYRLAALLSDDQRAALIAAILFALMPVHAQAVVWPSASQHLLTAACEFAAFELYLRRAAMPAADGRRAGWLAASLALYAGALLSHETAIAFPLLIATHAFLFGPHRTYRSYRTYAAAVAAALPYAIEVAAYLGVRIMVLGFISRSNPLNHHPIGIIEIALTIPEMIWIYLMMLILPWRTGMHQLNPITSAASPGFLLPLLGLTIVCVVAYVLLQHDPRRRLHLFCAAWIPISLAAAFNLDGLFALGAIQDPYLYIPSFGFCLLAADLAVMFACGGKRRAIAVLIGVTAMAIWYAALLFSLEGFWHDDVTAFAGCVQEVPGLAFCHTQLGRAYQGLGEWKKAQAELTAALVIDPDTETGAYRDLARVDERLDDRAAAAKLLAQWIQRSPHPSAGAFAELAFAADAAGDTKGTQDALARAAALPGGADVEALARAQLMYRHGDRAGATRALGNLIDREPDNVAALNVLGAVMLSGHRYDEALAAYRRASALVPRDASLHYRVAVTLHQMGRDREALQQCRTVLDEVPDDPGAAALMAEIERSGMAK